MRILRLPGVFRPRSDTWMLAGELRELIRDGRESVLDVCTGSGAIALVAAHAGARVTAVDVSRRAVATVRLNARLRRLRVEALRGNLFEPVAGRRFDVIVSNPPYLPAADDELPRRGPARAFDAGRDGRVLIDRICAEAAAHLTPGGSLLLIHSSLTGVEATLERLAESGLEPQVVARREGPLGPLLAGRAEQLERRGLLAPGERKEDLVAVRGRLV